MKKSTFPDRIIEAFGEDSFYTTLKDDQAPTTHSALQAQKSLMNVGLIFWKTYSTISVKMLEKKILKDILLIGKRMKILKLPK